MSGPEGSSIKGKTLGAAELPNWTLIETLFACFYLRNEYDIK